MQLHLFALHLKYNEYSVLLFFLLTSLMINVGSSTFRHHLPAWLYPSRVASAIANLAKEDRNAYSNLATLWQNPMNKSITVLF